MDIGNGSTIDNLTKPSSLHEQPKQNWSLMHEIMFREHGLSETGSKSVKGNGALGFKNRLFGARHTVENMCASHTLQKYDGHVTSVSFNKAGNLLVSGWADLKIVVWNWAANKIAYEFSSGHKATLWQTKIMELEDGLHIISSGQDGQVRHAMIPPSGGTEIVSNLLFQHPCSVHNIALQPQNPYEILWGSSDIYICIYQN